jgi:hypothetical protein
VSATVGSFGYDRFLTLGSTALGGGSLLYAGEFKTYDGPWVTGEDVRKFSGLLRYSQGTATNGFSATAMGYTNNWNSTDQVALRAITTGQIGRFGEIDPSDGGDTSRFMVSTRFAQSDDLGLWKANAYFSKYTLNLWNNFTWFTTDPMNGDQFHQHDDRLYGGGGASRTINGTLFGRPTETLFAARTRYRTIRRAFCRRQLSVQSFRARRRRRLAMVQSDRQQSSSCSAGLDGCAPVGSFHGFHNDQGLRIDPRPAGFCVRSLPPLRHCRVGDR